MNTNPAKRKTQTKPKAGLVRLLIGDVLPSPENDKIYRPISADDPGIIKLSESMKAEGQLEAIVVSQDGWILSGHRRHFAARMAGLTHLDCRIAPVKRNKDREKFLRLLVEYNRPQREKNNAERLREEIVSQSADVAHAELYKYRRELAMVPVKGLKVGQVRLRKLISNAKQPMLKAALAIIKQLLRFGPTNKRTIHYHMCNKKTLRHTGKPGSLYKNDRASYRDLCDLLLRASLAGLVSMDAIIDETRPVEIWDVHQTARPFIERELDDMFRGFYRDLMQSQTNHFEILCEKNTVLPLVRPIAAEYTIPITSGRGFCSLPPRHSMSERFKKSGKEKLVLLIVSDFDPEGESIAESFARSMRDDFEIDDIHAIKVALTYEQVQEYQLLPDLEVKQPGKGRGKKFVEKYGINVYELEALDPEALQTIVRQTIESVIDREAYGAEIEAERNDAQFLAGVRQTVTDTLSDIDFEE